MNNLSEELKQKYLNVPKAVLNAIFLKACSDGDSDSVSWILSNENLQRQLKSDQKYIWFETSCFNGHLNVVKELDENHQLPFDLHEGIECAIESNHEDVIQYLFNSKKNILQPLAKKAIADNNLKLIKRIFNDPSVIELNKNNPRLSEGIIMIDQYGFELKKLVKEAFTNNNLELVKFLLDDTSTFNSAINSINFTAILNSKNEFIRGGSFQPTQPEMYFYVLQYCDERNIEIPYQILDKLFFKACEENYLPMVKYLLHHSNPDKRVDINAEGDTGLLKACHRGHLDMVKYLLTSPELEKHANIYAQDNSPLMYAAQEGHLKLVEYLTTSSELKNHADIHAQDEYALFLAFKGDYKEVVQFFLESPKLKTHLDIFKNFNELKEQHISNIDDDLTEPHYHYDMKTLIYLVYEYQPFTNNSTYTHDIEEMLESNDELKLAYRAIQLSKELNQKPDGTTNNPKKLKL